MKFHPAFCNKSLGPPSNCAVFEILDKKQPLGAFRTCCGNGQMIAVLRVILVTLFAAKSR
jgi:hypothetical protein